MQLQKLIVCIACTLFKYAVYAQIPASSVSVHFEFDKSDINATDLAALKSFKSSHPNIESIIIDGYADTTGTDNYNYALSVRRCNTVKQALSYDESITEVLLRVGAHGEKDLLYQTNPENRVVIVAINDKKAKLAAEKKRIEDSIAAEALKKSIADSLAKLQVAVETKTAQSKNNILPATVPLPKVVTDDDASALIKLLQNSKAGESVVLDEIHFEEGRHVLLKSSKPALNAMLDALKQMPALQLEIQGHICCDDVLAMDGLDVDTKEFQLSFNRAKTVYDYFVQNGIDASRLRFKGFGTRKRIVNPEKTDKDRNENRRVEFLIVKK